MANSRIEDVLVNEAHDAAHWIAQASALDGGPALVAAVRAVGRGASREVADRILAKLPRLAEAASKERTQQVNAVIHNIKRFGGGADKVANAALEAIADGAEPSYLLRAIAQALDQTYASIAALDVIRGAIAIAPPDRGWYEDTHALVLMSLARFDEATAAIGRLSSIESGQAAWLGAYVTALQQPFTHWYARWFEDPADDATPTKRELPAVHEALRAIASRIAAYRAALVVHVGDAPWLPDVRAFAPGEPDDDFDLDDNEGSVPNTLAELRKEWTRLVWLLLAVGERTLVMPEKIAAPPHPLDFIDTILSVRFNLLVDRSEGKPFAPTDQLDEQAGEVRWGGPTGMMLKELVPHLAELALGELSCALAAIRWANGAIDDVFEDQ